MKKLYITSTGQICFIIVFVMASLTCSFAGQIHLFAGAGLRQPIDRLIQTFESRTGHKVFVDYGGSGKQCVRIHATGKGDLFMPGALFYIEKLQKAGIAHNYMPVAVHTPVVGVNRKSAVQITAFEDLAKSGMRIGLGDSKAMALGKTAEVILERSGLKQEILKNVTVYGATVKQLALYVIQGDVDAAIIGRADAVQASDKIRLVEIPKIFFTAETIAVALLTNGMNRPEVVDLQNYLSGSDAVKVFGDYGFLPFVPASAESKK
ncbi:molybdate ABC transporter substrate-binding protein [Desulfobacula toluolica]|uniref:Predicted molybdenum ABC transporter, periplasmic molybdate-binding protein n=1 Tax=Desulfobacula toluolica (strain DSM 7467 / Tol2) TaxID=651182 RepID=K0NP49_DESTT|nr:molybdate ABC transporter substrate-binding protein [Desulfobacula toluolica]CCK81898.1 predicted molybdenum ABC transporter, periplasmic molybdate-binding protein [Desulfobacula toluolica Tol2]